MKETLLMILKNNVWRKYTRQELARMVGANDRKLRELVNELRKEGHPICIEKNGKGYWYGTRTEYEKTVVRDHINRIVDSVQTVNAFYGLAPEGQISITDLMKGAQK